jgi:hypothetical protein
MFEVSHILGPRTTDFTIVDFETLPWVCTLESTGKVARLEGVKDTIVGAMVHESLHARIADPAAVLERLMGDRPKLTVSGHPLAITLISLNSTLHPPIMYSRWHDWDGSPIDHAPLFYETLNELGGELLAMVSNEITATTQEIAEAYPDADLSAVVPKYDWYMKAYGRSIQDKTSLLSAIRTNAGYRGLKHPMTEIGPGQYIPNFEHRFLVEDVPFGLAVLRGISEIAGVPTPGMDLILRWCQKRMGKEYLNGHGLAGADVAETRAPQRYGLTSVSQLLGTAHDSMVAGPVRR